MLLSWTLIVAFVVSAVLLLGSVRRIPQGQVHSVYRFGRPVRMLDAGLHVKWPLVDQVAHKISLSGHVLRIESVPSASGQTLDGKLYWQVLEPGRADPVINDAEALLRRSLADALAAGGDPEATPVARNASVKQALNRELRQRGILVTRVDLA